MIARDDAIARARAVAKLEFPTPSMEVRSSLHSDPWNECITLDSESEYSENLRIHLQDHTYWNIHFSPRNGVRKGGDICVFLDAESGAILGVYMGK